MSVRPLDGIYILNKRQVNKLRKRFPALFSEVVDGKVVPIEVNDNDVHIIIPSFPDQPVGIHSPPERWLGDISYKEAWRL